MGIVLGAPPRLHVDRNLSAARSLGCCERRLVRDPPEKPLRLRASRVVDTPVDDPGTVADEELVARSWGGDETALATLLERYREFVRGKARPYFLAGADREDIIQEGMIGLYKAIRDYDPSRRVSFRTFASVCTTRQIITAVKTAARQKHGPLNSYVSLHRSSHRDGDGDLGLLDAFASGADPADSIVSSEELQRVERAFAGVLSELETAVLERYVDGATYSEIAAELDRHVKSIDNALQRIKRKLDPYLRERRLEAAV